MNLQYISDSKGKTTGVFIPINDWKILKSKYKEIEQQEQEQFLVPEWHKEIIRKRLEDYKKNPENGIDWEVVQKEIEKKYGF